MAQVEQVFEQVAAPLPFSMITTAEVEQIRRLRARKRIQLKGTAVSPVSSIEPRADRGES